MKAIIERRIQLKNRPNLEKLIPLLTPFVIFIDPASTCNFRCRFCPTGDRKLMKKIGRYQGIMDYELYKNIIDKLGDFDKPIKVLRLYKDGEPLLNTYLHYMIRYAKNSCNIEFIDTTTNGALLDEYVSMCIIDAGLDRINISVNGISDETISKFSRRKVNFKKYVKNIKFLYDNKNECEICIKTTHEAIGDGNEQLFYDIFGEICDKIFIENFAPCWPEFDVESRTGVSIPDKGVYQNKLSNVRVCPYIFYSISINSDGIASLCFLDWERKLIIGDVNVPGFQDSKFYGTMGELAIFKRVLSDAEIAEMYQAGKPQ